MIRAYDKDLQWGNIYLGLDTDIWGIGIEFMRDDCLIMWLFEVDILCFHFQISKRRKSDG